MYSSTIVFLGNRIISGRTTYTEIVTSRPDLKSELDRYLIEQGRSDLIV
jgi:hypothetical protein